MNGLGFKIPLFIWRDITVRFGRFWELGEDLLSLIRYTYIIPMALRVYSISRMNLHIPISQELHLNAAATAGGLTLGTIYRTSTGQLMVRY